MKTALVIGPNFFYFPDAVCAAFRNLGYEPVLFGFDTPITPYRGFQKVKWKFAKDKEALVYKSKLHFNVSVLEKYETLRPDVVFVMNGDIFLSETIDTFRRNSKVALWLFDTLSRLSSSVVELAAHVDALFCFDMNDVRRFNDIGIEAHFLPQACDVTVYHPIGNSVKDIDILFVGNMYNSPKRKAAVLDVIRHFPDRKILVYGLFQPWYKGLLKWAVRPYKSVIRNVNLAPEDVNMLYNRSRVVLNIHEEHQKDGANPRLFEICGSGALQVCDANPYVKSLFGDSVMLYSDRDGMFTAIERSLAGDCADRAAKACEKVRMEHTFDNRIREVLNILQLL
ncbi:MAG: glycosyltransferase [Bacteroidales bacterium]|nr:glycosyltransferase [Candidatus Cacconaster merdequi]